MTIFVLRVTLNSEKSSHLEKQSTNVYLEGTETFARIKAGELLEKNIASKVEIFKRISALEGSKVSIRETYRSRECQ